MKNCILILFCVFYLSGFSQVRIDSASIVINNAYLIVKDGITKTNKIGGIHTKTGNSYVDIATSGSVATYVIPFQASNTDTISMVYKIDVATTGSHISFNSYEVNPDNTPLPTPTYVGGALSDTALHGIDRFWKIIPYGFSPFPQSTVTFTYSALDLIDNYIAENELQVKRYNSTLGEWNDKSYGVLVSNNKVTVPLTSSADFFNVWNLYYSPALLPIEFISFNSRCEDNGTLLEWKTAEELDAKEYIIETSKDTRSWTYVTTIPAQGRSLNDYKLLVNNSGYFRLTSVDINNRKDILHLSYSNCKTKELDWVVEGNIIKFNINIERLSVYNALGEVVSCDYNINQIQIPDTKQIYFIVANVDGAFHSFKIAKHE